MVKQPGIWVIFWTSITLLYSCKTIEAPEPLKTQLDSVLTVPISDITVPISYPIKELEAMLNQKLDNKVFEAPIAMNQKGDSLFLVINRFKPVTINYNGGSQLTYQVPLQIAGTMHGRVLGVSMKNRAPVETKVIVTLRSDLDITNRWKLKTNTSIVKVKWVEQPVFRLAGIKFDLSSKIEKLIFRNEKKITSKIDDSVGGLIKVEDILAKLWMNIQKPVLINRQLKLVWLKAEPVSMSERMGSSTKDTLKLHVNLKTKLLAVVDTNMLKSDRVQLGQQHADKSTVKGLDAFVLATIPFSDVNKIMNQVTDTMHFNFQGNKVRIKSTEIYGTDNGLAMRLNLAGDIKARLYLTGILAYNPAAQSLVIDDFKFDVNSEQSLVQAADWFSHDDIINRVRPHLSVRLEKVITALPSLILQGIEKGKLGSKMDVSLSRFDASLHQYIITRDNIQVVIHATGDADIKLQKEIFARRNKP